MIYTTTILTILSLYIIAHFENILTCRWRVDIVPVDYHSQCDEDSVAQWSEVITICPESLDDWASIPPKTLLAHQNCHANQELGLGLGGVLTAQRKTMGASKFLLWILIRDKKWKSELKWKLFILANEADLSNHIIPNNQLNTTFH